MMVSLASGRPIKLVALAAGFGLLVLAGVLVRRGLDATAVYNDRKLAKAPPPYRLAGAIALGLGFATIGAFATAYGLVMGLVFGAVGGFCCSLVYGIDPKLSKGLDADVVAKTGVKTQQVINAVVEAEAKIHEIEDNAGRLKNRELKGRIGRIVDHAHAVLDEIERDPKDLARARRFLVTYLDGTRNVIRDFTARQEDFADSNLANNFQSVLGTIEKVFAEQVEHLKRDENLDLEVAIEVLNTQLTREGVG